MGESYAANKGGPLTLEDLNNLRQKFYGGKTGETDQLVGKETKKRNLPIEDGNGRRQRKITEFRKEK